MTDGLKEEKQQGKKRSDSEAADKVTSSECVINQEGMCLSHYLSLLCRQSSAVT